MVSEDEGGGGAREKAKVLKKSPGNAHYHAIGNFLQAMQALLVQILLPEANTLMWTCQREEMHLSRNGEPFDVGTSFHATSVESL